MTADVVHGEGPGPEAGTAVVAVVPGVVSRVGGGIVGRSTDTQRVEVQVVARTGTGVGVESAEPVDAAGVGERAGHGLGRAIAQACDGHGVGVRAGQRECDRQTLIGEAQRRAVRPRAVGHGVRARPAHEVQLKAVLAGGVPQPEAHRPGGADVPVVHTYTERLTDAQGASERPRRLGRPAAVGPQAPGPTAGRRGHRIIALQRCAGRRHVDRRRGPIQRNRRQIVRRRWIERQRRTAGFVRQPRSVQRQRHAEVAQARRRAGLRRRREVDAGHHDRGVAGVAGAAVRNADGVENPAGLRRAIRAAVVIDRALKHLGGERAIAGLNAHVVRIVRQRQVRRVVLQVELPADNLAGVVGVHVHDHLDDDLPSVRREARLAVIGPQ